MGKQSRKKGSKITSKEQHKAKLKERRERREQLLDHSNNNGIGNGNSNGNEIGLESESSGSVANCVSTASPTTLTLNKETILEGDRVFIILPSPHYCFAEWSSGQTRTEFLNDEDQDDPELRRGVVRRLEDRRGDGDGDDDDDDDVQIVAHVQLLASLRVGDKTTKEFPIQNLFRDCMSITTKFQVGDAVVCSTSDGILPGIVKYLWPVWEFNRSRDGLYNFPIYEVAVDPSVRSTGTGTSRCSSNYHRQQHQQQQQQQHTNHDIFHVSANSEQEDCIMARVTETRFGVGDRVLINRKLTNFHSYPQKSIKMAFHNDDEWIHATVSAIDVFGPLRSEYGVYACVIELKQRVGKNKSVTGYVWKDNDEHIALVNSDPRERLIQAIEDDCSYAHIDSLVTIHSIDVSLIKDLLISKAIEFGSFSACRWLEETQDVDLASLSFPGGNSILHEISRYPHALKFVKNFVNHLTFGRKNDDGKTWLHVLRDNGELSAIDHALQLRNGLFGMLRFGVYTTGDDLSSSSNEIMNFAFDSFLSDMNIYSQHDLINNSFQREDEILENVTMQNFSAKKFIRFTRQWNGFHELFFVTALEDTMRTLLTNGHSRIFGELLGADESLLRLNISLYLPSIPFSIFAQPELYHTEECRIEQQYDITRLVIEGQGLHAPNIKGRRFYMSSLVERLISNLLHKNCEGFPLLSLLEDKLKEWNDDYAHAEKRICEYQIDVLRDNETLPGRIKILDILTIYPQVRLPNALEAVKARQCGILCWMVHRSFVKLNSKASTDEQLRSPFLSTRSLEFLGPQHRIPSLITTGTFLCFACIEYDSLHALSWLSKDQNAPLGGTINGFTFLHTCAYFGRLDFILWFHKHPEWKDTVKVLSTRKGFEYASVIHVAVMRNHTNVADLLLKLGCPSIDGKGRSPDIFALKSSHDFVQKWGENMLKPIKLEEDIRRFFKFLAKKRYDTAKRFVCSSDCLAIDRWIAADIYHASGKSLPSGETYESIISKCIDSHNDEFVLWLCDFITRSEIYDCLFFNENVNKQKNFWAQLSSNPFQFTTHVKYLDLPAILDYLGNDDLVKLLSDPSMQDIRVIDSRSAWLPRNTPAFVHRHITVRLVYEAILGILPGVAGSEIQKYDDVAALECIALKYRNAATILIGEDERGLDHLFAADGLITREGERYINMNAYFCISEWDDARRNQLLPYSLRNDTERLFCFLAVENCYSLLVWLINHGQGWTAQMELDIIQIASYLGHEQIVSFFLDTNETIWVASCSDHQDSAILGAAEAGRERYWRGLIKNYGLPSDLCLELIENPYTKSDTKGRSEYCRRLFSSHAVVIVYSYLSAKDKECQSTYETMISLLLGDQRYQPILLLKIAQAVFNETYDFTIEEAMPSFVDFLCASVSKFYPRRNHAIQKVLFDISKDVVKKISYKGKDEGIGFAITWMKTARKWGIDLESFSTCMNTEGIYGSAEITNLVSKLRAEQGREWAKLDIIKKDQPLSSIKAAVDNGNINFQQTDRNGLSLMHLASAYDKTEVLSWLVECRNADIGQKDGRGRTPLEVAKACKASGTTKWLEERQAMIILTRFFKNNLNRGLVCIRRSRMAIAASKIQALQRGNTARKSFRGILLLRVEESLRFHGIWDRNLATVSEMNTNGHTWSSTRKLDENRISSIDDLDEYVRTSKKLEAASASAMSDETIDDQFEADEENEQREICGLLVDKTGREHGILCEITVETKILFTYYVMKWLRNADAKYREFFVRRLKQLQQGETSRILAKRLKGSNTTIFETYLEQKSGHRILWRHEQPGHILIWFVAKHKHVSRLMQLIDDSESRSARQRISLAEALPGIASKSGAAEIDSQQHRVLLNPLGNVPLKVFGFEAINVEEVRDENWSPRLYMTEQERRIIESKGTVLLLGRSGTGKTICICNRMELDAQRFHHLEDFTQLFVSRSQRLCRFVSETVGFDAPDDSFTTFGKLISTLEKRLPNLKTTKDVFLNSKKMDFARFKREFYHSTSTRKESEVHVDPLLVWTSIRTFCKGSIEALQEPQRVLGKSAFLSLGERRCRLDKAHREVVYDIFHRYQKICNECDLWDECDRITTLISRIQEERRKGSLAFKSVHRNKIYIDEIQDYTQAEICILFLLSGAGDLFMAGDPAQSVAEGVEFRFEDIRSVAYHMSDPGNRELIPQKPKVVTINFRSHSGVMDTAAAILRCMFDAFPYSAKQLTEDRGLFSGPRPGVFHRVQIDRLRSLISEKLNGIVVLVHDSSVQYWKKALGEYPLVYGIRAAKGLEFKSVIILDFFSDLPREFQKPWRNLLLGRTQETPKLELEGQLKLLYTAVTRCIEQLFFAETTRSSGGDAFVRWITTTTIRPTALATRQNVDDVEKMTQTQDEWVASGLDNAEMAESVEETNLEECISFMEKALHCFEQGKDVLLSQKARTHRTALLFRQDILLREIDDNAHTTTTTTITTTSYYGPDGIVEVRASELMGQLLSEGSLLAALRVVKFSLKYFGDYSRDRLEATILSEIDAIEQSC